MGKSAPDDRRRSISNLLRRVCSIFCNQLRSCDWSIHIHMHIHSYNYYFVNSKWPVESLAILCNNTKAQIVAIICDWTREQILRSCDHLQSKAIIWKPAISSLLHYWQKTVLLQAWFSVQIFHHTWQWCQWAGNWGLFLEATEIVERRTRSVFKLRVVDTRRRCKDLRPNIPKSCPDI